MNDIIEFFAVRATSLGRNAMTLIVRLFGVGVTGGTPEEQEQLESAEVYQPVGIMARPVVGAELEAVVIRDAGGEAHVLSLVDKSLPVFADADCKEGELVVYGPKETTARLRVHDTGDWSLIPKAGQKVHVGGLPTDVALQPMVLGNDAQDVLDDHAARIETLEARLATLISKYNTHTHGGAVASPLYTPPVVITTPAPNVKATKGTVK